MVIKESYVCYRRKNNGCYIVCNIYVFGNIERKIRIVMRINNLEWKVCYSDNLKEDLFAQTNYATLTIYVSTQVKKQNVERSLMHELVHAYCYSYGLMFFESFDREQLCEFISHNIFNLTELYSEAIEELNK